MFAVKSAYSIGDSPDKTISLYVADGEIYFARNDISDEIYGSLFGIVIISNFENYVHDFVKFTEFRDLFLEKSERFIHRDFWRNTFNKNFNKVVTEVCDAQHFTKEYFRLVLPQDWNCLNVDAIIANLPVKATEWIEKCYKSLQILATNDEQQKLARRVFDEAWKILKERKKVDNRPTVCELLTKFGITNDDLIQAILDVHETKFANEQARRKTEFVKQHDELKDALTQTLH